MRPKVFFSLLKLFLNDTSSRRFACLATLGLAFSITVVLGTVGIMDGFVSSLMQGLRKGNGEITLYSHRGFFSDRGKGDVLSILEALGYRGKVAPIIQTEALVSVGESSRGVLLKGIFPQSFQDVTGLKISVGQGEMALGEELAKALGVKVGDQVTVGLPQGNDQFKGMPLLVSKKVSALVHHGVYQRDARFAYLDLQDLQTEMGLVGKVNLLSLKSLRPQASQEQVLEEVENLEDALGVEFEGRAYWQDYSSLVEAVEIEKIVIALIFQLIVVIACFNVLAFITFLTEKKSQELFLFQALGLSKKSLSKFWYGLALLLWLSSCLLAIVLMQVFSFLTDHLSLLKLPAKIYYLNEIHFDLGGVSYAGVFLLTLIWLLALSFWGMRKIRGKSVLYGLRREFR